MPATRTRPRFFPLWRSAFPGCAIILLGLSATGAVQARSFYAAETGRSCARCHVDPAGGGIRTATGFRYAADGHTLVPLEERAIPFDPRVADGLRVGADLRGQYHEGTQGGRHERSTFFLMQASLYAAAELGPRVSFVYAHDLAHPGRNLEAFALIGGLPFEGTLKAGRFKPAFGLEDEDHTSFTRDPLGFGAASEDTGLELSLAHGRERVDLALVNGNPGGGTFDDNAQKGIVLRSWYQTDRLGFGLNGYSNKFSGGPGSGMRRGIYGAFGHLRRGPCVLLIEYDRTRDEYSRAEGDSLRARIRREALCAGLAWRLAAGHTASLRYDRLDPDLEYAETARDRLTLGLESELLPLVRLLAFVRGTREYGCDDQGCGDEHGTREYGQERDSFEFLAQLHVSF